MKKLAILVIVGALLDVAVFGFVIYLAKTQATQNAKSDCWDHLLDKAVTGPLTPDLRAHLTARAHHCARLPG